LLGGGERLAIELRLNADFGPTPENAAVRDFIIQPNDPWFSIAEREWLRHVLRGDFVETSHDAIFVGRIEGQIVGALWYATHFGFPQVGVFGYVLTDPAHRGKGIGSALTEAAVRHFLGRGGRMLYLGTGNPVAHHIYAKHGFRDYNGHVMRLSAPSEVDDADYFADVGPATVRDATPGDYARLTALYVSPDTWFTRDFHEGLFNDPSQPQARCNSCWAAVALRKRSGRDAQLVLESPSGAIVGVAILTHGTAPATAGVGEVELLVHPTHVGQGAQLVTALIGHAEEAGTRTLVCHTAACDEAKVALLRQAGFEEAGRIPDYFNAGRSHLDLVTLRHSA
jgi:ribosomal protein S18 acetylase RimI-like enzyme